jgi:hypothetical protein
MLEKYDIDFLVSVFMLRRKDRKRCWREILGRFGRSFCTVWRNGSIFNF